jgi:uncharacterized membrane-anchored protein
MAYRDYSSGGGGLEGILGYLVAAAIIGGAIAGTTVTMMVYKEVARIYSERGFKGTKASYLLWIALSVLLLVCGLAMYLPSVDPTLTTLSLYLAVYAFSVYVVVIEGVDLYLKRFDVPAAQLPEAGTLDGLPTPPAWEADSLTG